MKILVSEKQYNIIKSKLIKEGNTSDPIIVTNPNDPKLIYYKKAIAQYNKFKIIYDWNKKDRKNYKLPEEFLKNLDKNLTTCGYKPNTQQFKKVKSLVLEIYNNLVKINNDITSNPNKFNEQLKMFKPQDFSNLEVKINDFVISSIKIDIRFKGKKRLNPLSPSTPFTPYVLYTFNSRVKLGKLPSDLDLHFVLDFEPIKPTEVILKPKDKKEIKPKIEKNINSVGDKDTILEPKVETPKLEPQKPVATKTTTQNPNKEYTYRTQTILKQNVNTGKYTDQTLRKVPYAERDKGTAKWNYLNPPTLLYVNPQTGEETPNKPKTN